MNSQDYAQVPKSLMTLLPVGERNISFQAVVSDVIRPLQFGRIKFQGTTWRAKCRLDVELAPGTLVQIIDRSSNTLTVEHRVLAPASWG